MSAAPSLAVSPFSATLSTTGGLIADDTSYWYRLYRRLGDTFNSSGGWVDPGTRSAEIAVPDEGDVKITLHLPWSSSELYGLFRAVGTAADFRLVATVPLRPKNGAAYYTYVDNTATDDLTDPLGDQDEGLPVSWSHASSLNISVAADTVRSVSPLEVKLGVLLFTPAATTSKLVLPALYGADRGRKLTIVNTAAVSGVIAGTATVFVNGSATGEFTIPANNFPGAVVDFIYTVSTAGKPNWISATPGLSSHAVSVATLTTTALTLANLQSGTVLFTPATDTSKISLPRLTAADEGRRVTVINKKVGNSGIITNKANVLINGLQEGEIVLPANGEIGSIIDLVHTMLGEDSNWVHVGGQVEPEEPG